LAGGGFISWPRSWRAQIVQETLDGAGNFDDGAVENLFISARGFAVAAHFADELEGGGGDFLARGGLVGGSEDFNTAAHILYFIACGSTGLRYAVR
jgi:hypothetical protein